MAAHVFTYGSLMFPDVWKKVVRGRYRSATATVRDHARLAVAGETYPGMIRATGNSVAGVLYFDVDLHDLAALDAFEGADYQRQLLQATLDSGESVPVHTYIYLDPDRLGSSRWLPAEFQLQRFLDTYCRGRLTE